MSKQLDGRSIFITGGGSGIGRAVAITCAAAGASVFVTDKDLPSAESVASHIVGAGGRANAGRLDVTNEEETKLAVDKAVVSHGHIDGACNAAGMTFQGRALHEIDLEFWDLVQAVNLRGTFISMKYQLQAMLRNGGGSIVNIASTAGIAGIPNGSDYCAAKGGVVAMTRGAALDYATKNVRINAVLPGATRTPMLQHALDIVPGLDEAITGTNPMNRLGEPDEIANAVKWLISSEASFVTGLIMPVDGGTTT